MDSKAAAPPRALPALDHEAFLRRSFDVARRSREQATIPSARCWSAPTARFSGSRATATIRKAAT